MTSLLTNSSAMTALQTLKSTNSDLATTQDRIATGKKVNTASDNAAYWSISVSMTSQSKTLGAAQEALGIGKGVVDTAKTALEESIGIAEKIQAKLATLGASGVDAATVNEDVAELSKQIVAIAKAASFQGVNLLETGGAAAKVVTGYTQGDVSAGTGGEATTIDVAAYDLEGGFSTAPTTASGVEETLAGMRKAAASLGGVSTRIESQTSFNGKLIDAIDRGVGSLVDADMNAESARLSALQVQQQLGVQALSIANQSSQSIMSLFR